MRTYDKDEKLEEINNGGKQSCGKGNSKNRRGRKIKGQHRSTSPQRHQLDKEASQRRHMTAEGGKSLAMNLKSSTDHRTRDMGPSDTMNGTDNQEKDEKQSQNDKTGLGMEKTVKDKAKSKPESQSSQKVNRKVNWSKSKSTQVNPEVKVKEI
ncbi:hypothetical protein Tco_1273713 [Tanacetum coccineum]